jgi:hypothetical protein
MLHRFFRRRFVRPRRRFQGEILEDRRCLAAIVMSAHEQLLIELINRARADPLGEAARLGSDLALNSGTCNGVAVNISTTPKQPLAPHQSLADAAEAHAQDMLDRDYFSHTTLGTNNGPTERAQAEGYAGGAGENISTYRRWPSDFSEQERIDQVYARHKSLYESPCHRINMLRDHYEDIGTGVRFGDYTFDGRVWKAVMVVENFGSAVGGKLTGVAYNEAAVVDNINPDDGIYNVGEGVGGLTITARDDAGNTYTTTTGPSGGYELAAPAGVYTLTASGGVLGNAVVTKTGVRHRLDGFDNTKVDFETGTAVSHGPLTVNGTAGDDTIAIRPKPGDPRSIEVLVNGQSQSYANDSVTEIFVNGLAGNDRFTLDQGIPHNVTFDGGAGDDIAEFHAGPGVQTVVMRPALTQMTGDGPEVTVQNTEETRVAGDAEDVALLHDSPGNDMFYGRPAFSYLTGAGFYNYVAGFGQVYAYGNAGGLDKAFLYDSAGNDNFYGRPTFSYLQGAGFYYRATRFDEVYAYASGGVDKAFLYDSAGNDKFDGRPNMSYLQGPGFYYRASRFDEVYAYATAGGVDQAFFYDSSGDDKFYGRPTFSYLQGAGFLNRASNFGQVYAFATAGGVDQAYLYDSSGDDRFFGRPTYSYLEGDGFYNRASGFGQVYAFATAGGVDKAFLYDSSGDDRFFGRPTYSYLEGPGFYNRAAGFDEVYAYASAGLDKAFLYDSAGDDRLFARPNITYLYGDGFYNRATGFDEVYSYATAGGFDRAFLYDSAGDDEFRAQTILAYLAGEGFYNYARGFHYMEAIALGGGIDRFTRVDPLAFTLVQKGDWEL